MIRPIRLLVENPESSKRKLRIIAAADNFIPSSNSYRASTIFPAFPHAAESFLPPLKENFKVVLFFCRSTFSSLGYLSQELGSHKLSTYPDITVRSCIWISHGLASIILISNDEESLERVQKVLQEPLGNLIAKEIWQISSDGTINISTNIFINETADAPILLEKWNFQDPDLEVIVDECTACLNILYSRATLYFPEMNALIFDVVDDISILLRKLKNIEENCVPEASSEIQQTIATNRVYREEWHHRLVSELIEYNSVISYVISQGFSGHTPILNNECQIRNYNLLGVGSAYKALVYMHHFVSSAFEIQSFKKLLHKFEGILVPVVPFGEMNNLSKWPLIPQRKFEKLGNLSSKNKRHFVYFSGRGGFRETHHAIISAMQVLSAADSVRWSLIVNTHEYMHSIVRAILSEIIPLPILQNKENVAKILELHNAILAAKFKGRLNLKEFLTMICIHYLHLTAQNDHFDKFQKAARLALDANEQLDDPLCTGNVLPSLPNFSDDSAGKIQPDNFKEILGGIWLNISEILAHTLDFIYFYDSDPELFIRAIWLSWSTIPSAVEQTEEYVLRTVSVVAAIERDKDTLFRYKAACSVVEEQLKKIATNNENFLINRALKIFSNKEAKAQMGHCFLANLFLVDMIYNYFNLEKIIDYLRNPGGGYSDSNVVAGSYDLKDISNPIHFIKTRLMKSIDDIDRKIPREKYKEQYSSLWLLLACSSLYSEE